MWYRMNLPSNMAEQHVKSRYFVLTHVLLKATSYTVSSFFQDRSCFSLPMGIMKHFEFKEALLLKKKIGQFNNILVSLECPKNPLYHQKLSQSPKTSGAAFLNPTSWSAISYCYALTIQFQLSSYLEIFHRMRAKEKKKINKKKTHYKPKQPSNSTNMNYKHYFFNC